MLYSLPNQKPKLTGEGHFIAPNASVIGDVELHANSSVWFGTVIRGDVEKIVVGENSNVQDLSMLHADPGKPLVIGKNVTVGHKVMLHGCEIGDNSLIGMNAVILTGAKIGKNCIVGASALVTENTVVPDGTLVIGSPAKTFKPISEDRQEMLPISAEHYAQAGAQYAAELELCDFPDR